MRNIFYTIVGAAGFVGMIWAAAMAIIHRPSKLTAQKTPTQDLREHRLLEILPKPKRYLTREEEKALLMLWVLIVGMFVLLPTIGPVAILGLVCGAAWLKGKQH